MRNVRNFWITLDVDGRKERIETGPRQSFGGFRATILMREDGGVSDHRLTIDGQSMEDGTLRLVVCVDGGGPDKALSIETKR